MAARRRSSKGGTFFVIEKYFYLESEQCPTCPPSINTPRQFHCAQCHRNLNPTSDIRYELSKHYRNRGHSLDNPPRAYEPKVFADLNEQDQLLVSEGIFSFLAIIQSVSFNCFKFFSKYINICFNPKFSLSPRKCSAIAKGVYAPLAEVKLTQELKDAPFLTIGFDGSIMHHKKLFPIIATFFESKHKHKICHRLLGLRIVGRETADDILNILKEIIGKYKISEKIVAMCGDNCPTNYGSRERTGKGNVFAKLQQEVGAKIFGIGCIDHVLHNAVKHGCKQIDKDIETMLYKLFKYFQEEPSRGTSLLEICLALGVDCQLPESYVQTRWLSMDKALTVLILMFSQLRDYFNGVTTTTSAATNKIKDFKKFFSQKDLFPWLVVLQSVTSEFKKVA